MHGTLLFTKRDNRLYLLSAGTSDEEFFGYCVNDPLPTEPSISDWFNPAITTGRLRQDMPFFMGGGHDEVYRFIFPDLDEVFEGEEIISPRLLKVVEMKAYLATPSTFVVCGIIVKGRRLFSIHEIDHRRKSGEWQLRLPIPPHVVFGRNHHSKATIWKFLPAAEDFDFFSSHSGKSRTARLIALLPKLGRAIEVLRFHPVVRMRLAVRAHYLHSTIPPKVEEQIAVALMRLEGRKFKEIVEIGAALTWDDLTDSTSLQLVRRLTIGQVLRRLLKGLFGLAPIEQNYLEFKRQCDAVGVNVVAMCIILAAISRPTDDVVMPGPRADLIHRDIEQKIVVLETVLRGRKDEAGDQGN